MHNDLPQSGIGVYARLMRTGAARRGGALAVAVAVAILAGAVYHWIRSAPPAAPGPAEKLVIAVPTLPHFTLVHIAATQGYFAEEGLAVSVLPVDYGATAIRNLIAGSADIAIAAEAPFVTAAIAGDDLKIIASVASTSGDNTIVARRGRGIATAADLRGKTVGVTFNTSGAYFLWAFLIRNKLPTNSIVLVDLPPNRLAEALRSGSVDAVSAWQPISNRAQAALGADAVSFTEADAYSTTLVAIGRSEFLKTHPATVEKLVRALLRGEQFMQSHPEQALTLAAAWLDMDANTLRATWKQFDFRIDLLQSQLNAMEDEARWARSLDPGATGPPPNFLTYLYLDALLAVRPERVTVLH